MKTYRTAFNIVLVMNLVLVGVLAGLLVALASSRGTETAATPASNPVPKQESKYFCRAAIGDTALSYPTLTRTSAIHWREVRSRRAEGTQRHHSHDGDGRD